MHLISLFGSNHADASAPIDRERARYPESLDVSEIGMRTGWKINKILIDDLVNDGIIEWDDLTTIKLNG
jgi:hypothetical protein